MISNAALLQCNQRGLIPGPLETEEQFLKRVEEVEAFYASPPFAKEALLKEEDWKEAREITSSLFDMSPDWVIGFYSNRSLHFWQGAAAWVSESEAPLVQIRESFRKGMHLHLYHKKEVLAHELVHAARMAFCEPKYEEVLAFSTSKNFLRRWGGPFFVRSWEAGAFLLLFAISYLGQFLFFGERTWWAALIVFLPWIALLAGCFRLWVMHTVFQKAVKKIAKMVKDPSKALAVALRLKDQELSSFASLSEEKCKELVEKEKGKSLRWRLLHLAYF